MAKIALLFSGLPRQWQHCVQSQLRLFQKNSVDVFFYFWDTIDSAEKQQLLNAYEPRAFAFEPQLDFTVYDSTITRRDNINIPSRMMSMYYSWKRVGEIFSEYQSATNTTYDYAVRLRADLMFFDTLDHLLNEIGSNELLISDHHNFNLINDMFALGGVEPILYYHTIFDHLLSYEESVDFNPERMLMHHLNQNGRGIVFLFSTLKMLVFRPHMVGLPIEECLKEHPGASKWLDPEVVEAFKDYHFRQGGVDGVSTVEGFQQHQIKALERLRKLGPGRKA
jgi:hypothetical protein